MRTVLVLVSFSLFLALSVGCASEEAQPLPDEELGEVNQEVGGPCRADDDCPLGEGCNFAQPHPLGDGVTMFTCAGYAVFGPTMHPCLTSLQCSRFWIYGSTCNRWPGSAHGECVAPPP